MAPPSDTYFAEPGSNIIGTVSEFGSPENEKQISIDPFSLRELPKIAVASPKTIGGLLELPASLLPGKPKFLSCSLPNSAHSSPRLNPSFLKKIRVSPLQQKIQSPTSEEDQQQDEQPNLPLEFYLRRSKSCAEGRSLAPSVDFDLWIDKSGSLKPYPPTTASGKVNKKSNTTVAAVNYDADVGSDEGFKCGALCLFLPGFGKAKSVRSSLRKEGFETGNAAMVSRTVSLEKFECGSWASSAIGGGDGDVTNNYFDLPMELIRSGANDANSPVSAAFLFDKDVKGVLKNGSSSSRSMARGSAAARKSHESGRHVRFSTASPVSYPASPASCVTPRLRKAREDFNAFLEAQSA